ncbi:protein phosphatase CheZ [Paremcibacter congregatus]|uniref:Uncharacterized protein n=1 Tax=Paremcibacter congregatus TaxID=2043170 RepID=A0A2G4YRX0_9PROT|nr:protein phosphatase CheZ [Paremcibacter congregatus]PHZ85010.1 hypothetical protein CRD36_09845 [Paremcibacter congregatus]QDE26014.1 hypothetical protein FIV45_01300 [Paremcibacter congregatus]
MGHGLLPEHIGPLVDRLRNGDHHSVSLPDVAALTEILMRSLESYFKSIDLTIYQECQSLADYMDDARQEIASLSPEHSDSAKIPRAGLELEAIVEQTESATNSIMESAERIMEADPSDMDAYTGTINDAVMQIFEACSFQDITGQRISKVVSTLEHVEDRVAKLINILGVIEGDKAKPADERSEDEALLNGPALEGEGIDQSEIDSLLNGTQDDDSSSESPEEAPVAEEAPETAAESAPEDVVEDAPAAPTADQEDVTENSSADDIDFMFDGAPADTDEPAVSELEPESPVAASPEEVQPETKAADEPEPPEEKELNLIEQAKKRKAEARAADKSKAKLPKPVEYEEDAAAGLSPKAEEKTTQSDIDALFS